MKDYPRSLMLGDDTAAPARAPVTARIPADVQASRDQGRIGILQEEIRKRQPLADQGDARAIADIQALQREISGTSKGMSVAPQVAPQQPQQPQQPPSQPASNKDDLRSLIAGEQASYQSTAGAGRGSYAGFDPSQQSNIKTSQPVSQSISQPRQMFGDVLQKAFEAKKALEQNLGERVAGGLDTLYGVVPATVGAVTQAIAKPFVTEGPIFSTKTTAELEQGAQKSEAIGQQVAGAIDKPIGKALGITGKETYQQPLGGVTQPIAEQVNKMFNVLGMTPEQISENLKSKFNLTLPPEDIRNMVVIGSTALPQAVKEVAPIVGKALQPFKEAASELQIIRPDQVAKEQMQAQFAAKQGKAGNASAAATEGNPFANQFTGEETVRGQFPQIKLSKTPNDASINEQTLRSQVVQEIMQGEQVRPGVVTANENTLRNEYTKAKMDTPEGRLFKQQIANEQNALSKYAEDRVDATGASPTLINDEQRGQRINDVFHGASPDDPASSSITGYLNQAKKQIYDSAFKKVGNNKIETTHVDDLLSNPQWAAGLKIKGVEGVQSAGKEYLNLAKTVGFEDMNGTMHPPGSVAAYDAVRKAMNAEWTPQNARAIQRVNQAIDKDIGAVADPALYKLGDKIHQVEKTIFGSKGIKTLFGELDANGVITSSTALEKIPSKLNNLPKDQWRHIRDTLDELANGRVRNAPEGMPPVPDELRQAAAAARAEIDGALAREVQKAGAAKAGEWNQNSTNKVLNSVVGEKILETFPPEEVRKFHTLNYGGHFMPGIHHYEGAGLQSRRIGMIEGNLGKAGTAAGAAVGGTLFGPPGAAIGGYYGGKAGVAGSEAMAAKSLQKEAVKSQKEMQKAAELGKTKLSNIGKK